MKPCPYCGEQIQPAAVKCRFCFEWLDPSKRPAWSTDEPAPSERSPASAPIHPPISAAPSPASSHALHEVARPAVDLPPARPGLFGEREVSRAKPIASFLETSPTASTSSPVLGPDDRGRAGGAVDASEQRPAPAAVPRYQAPGPFPQGQPLAQPLAQPVQPSRPAPVLGAPAPRSTRWQPGQDSGPATAPPAWTAPEPEPEPEPDEPESSGSAAVWTPPNWLMTEPARSTTPPPSDPRSWTPSVTPPVTPPATPPASRPASAPSWDAAAAPATPVWTAPDTTPIWSPPQAESARRAPSGVTIRDDDDDEFDDPEFDDREPPAREVRAAPVPAVEVVRPARVEPKIEPAPAPAKAAKPAPAKPAKRAKDDDDDDDDDFDDDDDDDDDDEETGSMPAMSGGAMSAVSARPQRKLPWIPIAVVSGALVLVLGFVFKDSIFGGDEPEPPADEAVADSTETPEPAPPEPKDELPPPEPKDETTGEVVPPEPVPAVDDEELEAKLAEADTLYRKAKHDKAREILDGILTDAPKEPRALALLAQVLLEKGEFETALTTANDCVKVDAKEPNCWMTIAVIEQENKNFPRALEGFQKYLEIAPDGRFAKSAVKQVARLQSKVAG